MVKSATEEGSQERIELKSYMQGRAEGKVDSDLENKWGFLKNIINIDVFFAGPQNAKSSDKSTSADESEKTSRDVEPEENIKPTSSWRPSKSEGNEVKKSSSREKSVNGDLEDAIESGEVVTDSKGNIYPKSSKKEKAEAIKDEIKKLEKKKEDLEVEELQKKKEELEKSVKRKEVADQISKNAKEEAPSDSKIVKTRASTPEQRGKADKE